MKTIMIAGVTVSGATEEEAMAAGRAMIDGWFRDALASGIAAGQSGEPRIPPNGLDRPLRGEWLVGWDQGAATRDRPQ